MNQERSTEIMEINEWIKDKAGAKQGAAPSQIHI